MIALSAAARAKIALGVGYYVQTLTITLTDGTVLNINNERILGDTGVEIEDATSGNDTFEVGSAIINQCRFTLVNFDATYDDIDFYGAKVQVGIGIPLGINQTEPISKGEFYVVDQTISDSSVTLTCYDAMQKFDKPYSLSTLAYPATLAQIVANACTVCGVTNLATNFPNKSYVISTRPDDEKLTFREVIAWSAQLAGCYARINTGGALTFGWYDVANLYNEDAEPGVDYHDVSGVFSRTSSAADIEITGIKIIVKGENGDEVYATGDEGYVLEFSGNGFLTSSNANTFLDYLGDKLIGLRFRKLEATHLSNPAIEAGDIFRVKTGDFGSGLDVNAAQLYVNDAHLFLSKRGYYYCGLVTYTKFSAGGNQVSRCSAEDKVVNQSTRYNSITKLASETRKQILAEKTEREGAVEQLEYELANSPGLYITAQVQPDQTTIYYAHDKSTLAESTIVWKFTSTAIGISTDGGQTYPYGLDVSGTAILQRLYVEGIDANYVKIGNKSVVQTLADDYYTETETDQQIDAGLGSLSSTISQTYTTKQEFNNLEIGGENLVRGTGDFRNAAMSASLTLVDATEDEENIKCCNFPAASTLAWLYFAFKPRIPFSLVRGKKVTISFWYRSDSWSTASGEQARPVPAFELFKDQTSSRYMWYSVYDGTIPEPTTTWQRVVRTYTLNDSVFTSGSGTIDSSDYFSVSIFRYNNSHLQIKKVKLEFGDKATDWSPAPADLTVRLTSAESSITQNATQIALKVSQTDYDAQHIVDKINASALTINPDNISLSGKTIDLYTENIHITSGMQSISDTAHDGAYFGNDGIAFGKANVWIKSTGAFKFGAIRSSGSSSENAWVTNALLVSYGCEIYAGNQNSEPYIDMHRDVDSPQDTTSYDYTARISNSSDNVVSVFGKRAKNSQQAEQCTVTAGAFSQGSDRRLKNSIAPLDPDKAMAFIEALKPSSFVYNGASEHHHGFIHDEVDSEKYDRDWVVTQMMQNLFGDGVTYGTVSVIEIVPDIVATLQKLLQDNRELRRQIMALQSA